jgi:uracil-DNA glycosylase
MSRKQFFVLNSPGLRELRERGKITAQRSKRSREEKLGLVVENTSVKARNLMDDKWTISKRQSQLQRHVDELRSCRKCPKMQSTPVSGGAVPSRVMLVGQAPGVKEPVLGRPFAWTAGKAMFKWFEQETGVTEMEFRQTVYMAAVCRCFPGKNSQGGDRVPSREEVALCGAWLQAEIAILKPGLVIPVGKLAIGQFLDQLPALTELIGHMTHVRKFGHDFDVIPLPHPSGASPWHRIEPGKALTIKALALIRNHPAWIARA